MLYFQIKVVGSFLSLKNVRFVLASSVDADELVAHSIFVFTQNG